MTLNVLPEESVTEEDELNESSDPAAFSFQRYLQNNRLSLAPVEIETLQANITKLCNQTCVHCHVDASPKRTESMDLKTVERCLKILAEHESIKNLDLTGGAPELNQHFDYFVIEAKKLGKHVMVRHNLTVTHDGNPVTGESKKYLPDFFAEHSVQVISSLPYYQQYFTDKQRGRGVFEKSIDSIQMLNERGFGVKNSDRVLDLVYNPVGAFLPAEQEILEQKYKTELWEKFGLVFNELYVITNMPIHRFKKQLLRLGQYQDYLTKLVNAFNPHAATGVMCRTLISVSHDGTLYDCDFNQMLEMEIGNGSPMTVFDFDYEALINRQIRFDSHCFGCTAGSGSSCGGALSS